MKLLSTLGAVLLGLALLTGCSGGQPRAECPAGKRCLLIGNGAEPNTLDPAKSTGTWEHRVLASLSMGLTQDDAEGNPIPGMAERWETSADGLTWTFYLREAVWSDGVPVTADDFVYSLRRVLNPATASEYSYLINFIKGAQPIIAGEAKPETLGVRAIDPRTLEIRLEHPAPYILELAKHTTMFPVPRHVVERWGDAWVRPEHYVSNGPYKLVDWRIGNYIRVERNPRFFDNARVCFDQVDFFPTPDSVAAERSVRSGEIDISTDISSSRMRRLREEIPDYVRVHRALTVSYMTFNNNVPKLRDPRVRMAINMAIDREFLANRLMVDGKTPAYTFVPPGIANYTPPPPPAWASWPYERRQAEARRLMAEAGYTPERPLTIDLYHASNPDTALVMQSLQADFAAVGVRLRLNQRDTALNYQALRERDFEIATAGWVADFNDAANFLNLQRSSIGEMNYGDYNNPRFDQLLDLADNEPDVAKRAGYLREAEAMMLADMPVVPIFYAVNKNLVNPRLTGWRDNITDQHRVTYLCQQ